MRRHPVGVCCVALILSSHALALGGLIRGFVINEHGEKVPGAQVVWLWVPPERVVSVNDGNHYVTTDENGHFWIEGLDQGESYKLYAKKEDSNYPDMTLGFFNPKDEAMTVKAELIDKASDVEVKLGPKGWKLYWTVRDAKTNKPIIAATSFVRDGISQTVGWGFDTKKGFLMPAETDISMTVSARGYKTWYYPGTTDEKLSKPVLFSGGGKIYLKVRLEPE